MLLKSVNIIINRLLLIISLLPFISLADALENRQIGFTDLATPIMQGTVDLHHDILFFMVVILVFVIWMLARTFYHFNQSRNWIPKEIFNYGWMQIACIIAPFVGFAVLLCIPGLCLAMSDNLDNVVALLQGADLPDAPIPQAVVGATQIDHLLAQLENVNLDHAPINQAAAQPAPQPAAQPAVSHGLVYEPTVITVQG